MKTTAECFLKASQSLGAFTEDDIQSQTKSKNEGIPGKKGERETRSHLKETKGRKRVEKKINTESQVKQKREIKGKKLDKEQKGQHAK